MKHFEHPAVIENTMKTIFAYFLLFSTALGQKVLNTEENLNGAKSLQAVINVGVVDITLKGAGDSNKAYRVFCSYSDEDRVPLLDYIVSGNKGVFRFSNQKNGNNFPWFNMHDVKDSARVELSGTVPVSLTMNFGVCDANVDLGAMMISDATFSTGVCDFNLDFSSPNKIECDDINIKTGISSVTVHNLSNAHARNVEFNGGLGSVKIDFGGKLQENCEVHIKTGLGSVEISVPASVNTVITAPGSFLNSVDVSGFYSEGDNEYRSTVKSGPLLKLDIDSGLGSVNVRSY